MKSEVITRDEADEILRQMWKKPHKYRAKRTIVDGKAYPSKLEASYGKNLGMLERGGAIKSWRQHPTVGLYVNDKLICNYALDFEIIHNDDSVELVEVKGFKTRDWAIKWKLFEAIWEVDHPEVKRTLVR